MAKRKKEDKAATIGRPTDYGPEVIKAAAAYRDEKLPSGQFLHTIEGLAIHLGIARSTIYKWASESDKIEFSDIYNEILARQALTLINNGVKGTFNATITKVMLTKHGYREGIENTGEGGGPVKVDITDQLAKVYGPTT
jgi:hypothetical protein